MEENFVSPMTSGKVPEDLITLPTTAAADYPTDVTPFADSTLNEDLIARSDVTATPPGLSFKDLPFTLPQQQTTDNPPFNHLPTTQGGGKREENQLPLSITPEVDEAQEVAYELEVIDPFAYAPRLPKGAIKVGKVLGHGAFGEVYQGNWQGRPVALKKIDLAHAKKSLPQLDETQILESLQWEVSRLSTVSHPQLVSFYGIYEIDTVTYLAMEFCPGGDLQKRLAKENVSWAKRWQWALEITQGLAYLHEQGVLHRDLKAENILLDANDRAKLADLGVAQVDALLQDQEIKAVAEGLQDKKFIAPENIKNPTLSSKETDVYALGLVFWQLVTGQVPRRFIELSKEEYQAWYFGKGLRESIPSDCPEPFRKLILACWAHEPDQRIKLDALIKQLKQLATEFHAEPQMVRALESLDQLLHARRAAGLAYVPSFITQHPVQEPLDTYWRRWEANQFSKKKAHFRNPPLPLVSTLADFLNQPGGGTLLLLGESGLGKTLSVYQWADQLMQQGWFGLDGNSKERLSYLPLLVRPALAQWTHADLKDGLAKTLAFYGLPTDFAQPLLLIIDGYDECVMNNVPINIAQQLGISPQSSIKVVITCRPETVSEQERHPRFASSGQLQTAYFLSFSLEQLFQYMTHQLLWSEEMYQTYQNALNDNTALRTVLRNPFVLSLCVDSWSIVSKKAVNRLNRWQIYESFVEHVLLTYSNRLSATVKRQLGGAEDSLLVYFNQTAAHIAFELFHQKGLVLNAEKAKQVMDSAWLDLEAYVTRDSQRRFRIRQRALAAKNTDMQTVRRSLLNEADYVAVQLWRSRQFMQYLPLKHKIVGYEFSHKSFFEYFAARRLITLSQLSSDEAEKSLQDLLNARSLQEESEILSFWTEGWAAAFENQQLIEPLFRVITASRNQPQVAKAASNAATLLAKAKVSFWKRDLHGIAIPDADLSEAYCFGVQLQGADLRGVKLRRTCLSEANFIDARMEAVDLGEWPSLRNDSKIRSVAYSTDWNQLVVGHLDGTITFYQKRIKTDPLGYQGNAYQQQYVLRHGEGKTVTSVAFSPDGTRIASGRHHQTVWLWDAHQGAPTAVLIGHTDSVWSVVFSPDGARLASASTDQTVRLWDVHQGTQIAVLNGHMGKVTSVTFSPDGIQLASGGEDQTVRLWDVHQGTQIAVLNGHTDAVWSVAFSPDGTRLASGSKDKTVRLWDVYQSAQTAVLNGHTETVSSLAFSPDGAQLASGSWDQTVRLWDVYQGAQTVVFYGHTRGIRNVAFSPDGTRLASGSEDQAVRFWDVHQDAQTAMLNGHIKEVTSVAFNPDGTRFASGSKDKTVRLWDDHQGTQIAVLRGHTNEVTNVVFSPDGTRFVSGSKDKTVRLWDAHQGTQIAVLNGHTEEVTSVAFNPDGTRLASGSKDKTVRLWDAHQGVEIAVLTGHKSRINSVTFSPDSSRLASASWDRTVRLWDAHQSIQIAVLTGHTEQVSSVSFSPDGARLASASWDRTVRLWDAHQSIQIAVLNGHTHNVVTNVLFSPDGARFASLSWDWTVRLWDAYQGTQIAVLKGCTTSMVFSPDGARLASAGDNNTVRLWDVYQGTQIAVLKGHMNGVTSLVFSPDGARLISGDYDGAIHIWGQASGDRGYVEQWQLLYRMHGIGTGLLAKDLVLDGTTLSEDNRLLLEQRGVVNERAASMVYSTLIFGRFFSFAKDNWTERNIGEIITRKLSARDVQSLACMNRASYEFFFNTLKKAKSTPIESPMTTFDLFAETYFRAAMAYRDGKESASDLILAAYYFRLAAEKGHSDAKYYLGMCYANGQGVEQDFKEAVRYFESATYYRHATAQWHLGFCYENGQGIKQSFKKAVRYYRLAAEQGNANAQYSLAMCYSNGKGVEQDLEEAIRYYRLSAEQGNVDAQYNLGVCYANGQGVEQDWKEAVRYLSLAAEQGNAEAQNNLPLTQNNLGFCYENGKGIEQDFKEAARYYRLAADQGYADAQNILGFYYATGRGVEQDLEEAVRYYRLAAEQGHAKAQCELGICYANGQGVEQNFKEALRYYRLAAEQGNAYAQCNLGFCYEKGEGVEQDWKEAVRYYRLAAEQENVTAQYNLALCYLNGEGVEKNLGQAVYYVQLAAEQGNVDAQNNLGIFLLQQAIDFYFQNNLEEAIKAFKMCIELNIDSLSKTDIYQSLASLYLSQNKFDLSEQHFKIALELKVTSSLYCAYGLMLKTQKRFDEAIKMLLLAISLPDDASGLLYGPLEKAFLDTYLQKEIDQYGKIEVKPLIMAHYLLASCYQACGQFDKLAEIYKTFQQVVELENDPLNHRLLNYLLKLNGEKPIALLFEDKEVTDNRVLTVSTSKYELAVKQGYDKVQNHLITSDTSVYLFTSFFNAKSVLQESGKRIASYVAERDQQSIACVNQSSYGFFAQLRRIEKPGILKEKMAVIIPPSSLQPQLEPESKPKAEKAKVEFSCSCQLL